MLYKIEIVLCADYFNIPQTKIILQCVYTEEEKMDRPTIRQMARNDLGNKIFGKGWLMALVVLLIFSVIISAVSATVIGTFVLYGPLSIGVMSAFLTTSRKKTDMEVGEMFSEGFGNFGRNFLIGLMETIFIMLWSMLFVIPGIVKSYSYAMTEYIAVDNPDYDWKACIDASKEMMNGHKMELFLLDLSFIGWYLVGSITCGIGLLWVEPYHYAARTVFYRNLINDYNGAQAV